MSELLTAAEMRAIEQGAIDSGEVTGLELMERAGQGVVDAILDWRPELSKGARKAAVICGPGNNGGDGFVIARLLHRRGWEVAVLLYGRDPSDIADLPPDAAESARRWSDLGKIEPFPAEGGDNGRKLLAREPDLLVDALFGTGLVRPLSEDLLGLVEMTEEAVAAEPGRQRLSIVAVDAPSGLCMDSGRALVGPHGRGMAVRAHLTASFHRFKRGHFLADGPSRCGHLRCVDIGLKDRRDAPDDQSATRLTGPSERLTKRGEARHKYDFGHALILSGGVGKGGAARLAARGSLRVGAGLVTVGCPPAALQENASALDAIMLAPLGDADALAQFIAARKVRALCIGPGFGHGERLRAFLAAGLEAKVATVLDADAISEYADDPETLFGLLRPTSVLTPHEGEFGRLFGDILEKLAAPAMKGPAYSKVDATREAAARAGCVVLFKGADTVIADPQGRAAISSAHYERSAPWLATAGTGDVLAGLITGLLARGFDPMQAACTAAWLHVECARHFGPGLIAEDLPEQLPAVFRDLGL